MCQLLRDHCLLELVSVEGSSWGPAPCPLPATLGLRCLLGGQVLVGLDLRGELVLLHAPCIARSFRWTLSVLSDRVFEFSHVVLSQKQGPDSNRHSRWREATWGSVSEPCSTTSPTSQRKKAARGCGPARPLWIGLAGDDQSPASPGLVVSVVSSTALKLVLIFFRGMASSLQICTHCQSATGRRRCNVYRQCSDGGVRPSFARCTAGRASPSRFAARHESRSPGVRPLEPAAGSRKSAFRRPRAPMVRRSDRREVV